MRRMSSVRKRRERSSSSNNNNRNSSDPLEQILEPRGILNSLSGSCLSQVPESDSEGFPLCGSLFLAPMSPPRWHGVRFTAAP